MARKSKTNRLLGLALLLSALIGCGLLAGCAERSGGDTETTEAGNPERDESVFYEDKDQYRWGIPNELGLVLPRVPAPVTPEEFYAYGPIAGDERSFDGIAREATMQDEEWMVEGFNLFYPADDGTYQKVCTREECRANAAESCPHLVTTMPVAARFGDAVYFATSDGVLEWKIGAEDFDRLFTTEDFLMMGLHAVNGILYIRAVSNIPNEPDHRFAVRMDREISVEIPVSDKLIFGEDGIVSVGAGGVTRLDELLNPVRTLLDGRYFGALFDGYYWYVENGTLWRIRTDARGSAEKVFDGVADFAVSSRYLWTVNSETGVLERVERKKNGSFGGRNPFFTPSDGERIVKLTPPVESFQKPSCGEGFYWTATRTDESGQIVRTQYVTDGREIASLWQEYPQIAEPETP